MANNDSSPEKKPRRKLSILDDHSRTCLIHIRSATEKEDVHPFHEKSWKVCFCDEIIYSFKCLGSFLGL